MTTFWSVAQTHPHSEPLALRNLKRQNFNAFYPTLLVKNRFRRLIPKPVFPNYVFIELDDTRPVWSPINSTLGVRRLLTQAAKDEYRRPARVEFVESLRRLRLPEPAGRDAEVLPPGTIVRVTRGPFAEKLALVEMSTADRVRLLLEVFNRQTSVEFALADVVLVRRPTGVAPRFQPLAAPC